MPIYGDAKKRDICRGVLPSSRRKGARHDLQNIKQQHRARVRQNLHAISNGQNYSEDVIDAFDEAAFDFEFYPSADIGYAVGYRRDGDKLGALLRWAPTQVKDVRLLDRVSKMYQILPDNLIGRHAVSHIEQLDEFSIPYEHSYYYRRRFYATDEERVWIRAAEYAEIEARLRLLFEKKGALKRFNAYGHYYDVRTEITEAEYNLAKEEYEARYSKWATRGITNNFDKSYPTLCRYSRGIGWEYTYFRVVNTKRSLLGVHDLEDFIRDIGHGGYSYRQKNGSVEGALRICGV